MVVVVLVVVVVVLVVVEVDVVVGSLPAGGTVGPAYLGGGFGNGGSGDACVDDAFGIDGRAVPAGPAPKRRSRFIVAWYSAGSCGLPLIFVGLSAEIHPIVPDANTPAPLGAL